MTVAGFQLSDARAKMETFMKRSPEKQAAYIARACKTSPSAPTVLCAGSKVISMPVPPNRAAAVS